MSLPPLPPARLDLIDEAKGIGGPGFLTLRRQRLRARYPDGGQSEPFEYDSVERRLLDAVVVAAHYREGGERMVFLRSSLRPPLLLRPRDLPMAERASLGVLWELPAGLVERDEQSPDGLRRCAARELLEEAGLEIAPGALRPLGPPTFPAPAMIGERQFFFHVEVDPSRRAVPLGDGPLERHGLVAAIPLARALELARQGELEDAKTELALRRLLEA